MKEKNFINDLQKCVSAGCTLSWGFYFIIHLFMQEYPPVKFIFFLAGGMAILGCLLLSFFCKYQVCSILLPLTLFSGGVFLMVTERGITTGGDFFILAGIIIFFIYFGINTVFKPALLLIPVFTACIRLLLAPAFNSLTVCYTILTAAGSGLLIWLVYEAIRRKTRELLCSKLESDSLAVIGLNLAAVRHDFNLAVEVDCIRFLIEDIENNDLDSALKSANSLFKLVKSKHMASEDLLNAIELNKSHAIEPVNIHLLIESILQISRLDKEVFVHITFQKEFAGENFHINARACELYFIFQNLVANAIEAMLRLKEKRNHTLTITTIYQPRVVTITFKDTGGGIYNNSRINAGGIKKDGSRRLGGFGLRYVNETVKKYGSLVINSSAEGTTAVLTLQGAEK